VGSFKLQVSKLPVEFYLGWSKVSLLVQNVHGYPWVKSVTGMGQVAKRVSTGIINRYLTTHYYMDTDTDLIVPIPMGTLPDYPILSYYLKVVILLKEILPPT
jgi:hypothetical protein